MELNIRCPVKHKIIPMGFCRDKCTEVADPDKCEAYKKKSSRISTKRLESVSIKENSKVVILDYGQVILLACPKCYQEVSEKDRVCKICGLRFSD